MRRRRRRSIYHHNSSPRKEEATLDVRPCARPRVPSQPQSAVWRRILRAKSRSNAIGVLFAHFKKSSESGSLTPSSENHGALRCFPQLQWGETGSANMVSPLSTICALSDCKLQAPPSASLPLPLPARGDLRSARSDRDYLLFNDGGRRRRRVRPRRPSSLSRSLRPLRPPPPPLFAAF